MILHAATHKTAHSVFSLLLNRSLSLHNRTISLRLPFLSSPPLRLAMIVQVSTHLLTVPREMTLDVAIHAAAVFISLVAARPVPWGLAIFCAAFPRVRLHVRLHLSLVYYLSLVLFSIEDEYFAAVCPRALVSVDVEPILDIERLFSDGWPGHERRSVNRRGRGGILEGLILRRR